MKMFKVAALSLAVLCGVAAATAADAHGRGRGGAHFGLFLGAPLFFPYYAPSYYGPSYYPPAYYPPAYYPRYYYPPTVLAPPQVYIEQGAPAAAGPAPAPSAQSSTAYWYFCTDSQTYYPYVQQCATPWQQVVPQSSPPPS